MADEPSSDYGYDLVHEDVPSPPARPPRRADVAGSGPDRPSGAQPTGDYGYDEAHGF